MTGITKEKGKNNIQHILMRSITSMMLLLIGMIAVIFSFIQYNNRRQNAIENLHYTCSSVAENIDLKINQLDTIVLNTINSDDLTSSLEEYAESSATSYDHTLLRQRISALMMSLKGFDYSVRQLNAYTTEGLGYGIGDRIGDLTDYKSSGWYLCAVASQGRKYIPESTDNSDYLSIYRAYYDDYHNISGVVEGRMYYSEVFNAAVRPSNQYNTTVIVYDKAGNILYPSADERSSEIFPYLDHYTTSIATVKNTVTGRSELVAYSTTEHTDFTIVMAVSTSDFIRPIITELLPVLIVFIFMALFGFIFSYHLARRMSLPIHNIYDFLSDSESHSGEHLDIEYTGILEVDQLIDSINEYIAASEEQTKKIVSLNQQEIQAQMLALQSQMNPHFLYNSLASISEMARQGLTDSVTKMTVNISQILRHISSNREQVTTIEEELELCDMYLECMALRFGDNLHYEFDVDDEMLDYMIPKLCIQLLVENAIKSVTNQSPPWNLRIYGYKDEDNWYIEVQDNGPGFDPIIDKHLRSEMDKILETRTLPSLKIEGMGVLNIFIRFYLLDGITFIFDFGNREEGGAYVKVGRHLPK